ERQNACAARDRRAAITKETDGSTDEVDPGRLEEEPDLPGRRRRLALSARRQVHRDRRPLQPPDGSVADRARRGEGEGLAVEGRATVRRGRAAAEGEEPGLTRIGELVEYLARRLVEKPDDVRVEEDEEDGDLVVRLSVAPEDLGRVIGRGGRIARALRTLVRAAGAHEDRRVLLEIVE